MRIIELEGLEIHLVGSQAFIYSDDDSDVLNIDNVEFLEDPKEQILDELRLKNRHSLMEQLSLL